jgi:murein L,D-transpeptidase YafK
LGTSGNITILSNKPGNTAYKGLFTQNLMQNLQQVRYSQSKQIDWKQVLKQTDRQTRKQSRSFGRTQKIEKRKVNVKKSY